MSSFIAIDYETANSDYESVCAIGATVVENNVITQNIYSLIKPPSDFNFFDPFNVSIHGITKNDVKKSPSFYEIWQEIERLYSTNNLPLVCHYAGFDIRVTEAVLKNLNKEFPEIRFYDTCTVARKVWPELLNFKLNTLTEYLDIELNHHNAKSDSEACAIIAMKQMAKLEVNSLFDAAKIYGYDLGVLNTSGVKTMSEFKHYSSSNRYSKDQSALSSKNVVPNKEVNQGSDLFGQNIVFTGALVSMGRKEAIQRAVNNGAVVQSGVGKKTNFLIVGISDFLDFSKGLKTNKFKEAERLKLDGSDISIIDEEEFLRMTN